VGAAEVVGDLVGEVREDRVHGRIGWQRARGVVHDGGPFAAVVVRVTDHSLQCAYEGRNAFIVIDMRQLQQHWGALQELLEAQPRHLSASSMTDWAELEENRGKHRVFKGLFLPRYCVAAQKAQSGMCAWCYKGQYGWGLWGRTFVECHVATSTYWLPFSVAPMTLSCATRVLTTDRQLHSNIVG
jgi:hypothetical protein